MFDRHSKRWDLPNELQTKSAMNIVWIVADTFRQDHLGCYGNPEIRTPCLDALAQQSVRFDRHYAAGFPTMPTRANHHTGRWLLTRFGWQALPDDAVTLAQLLAEAGFHTAAVADTPFYWRNGMNYDRGFQSFFPVLGQGGPRGRFIPDPSPHEWKDVNAWWRKGVGPLRPAHADASRRLVGTPLSGGLFPLHRHLGPS